MTRPEGFEGVVKGFKTEINERDWMYVPDKELDNRLQDLYKEYEETVREGAPLGWPTSRPFQQLMAEQLGNSGYDEDEMKDGQLARCTAEILHEFATEKKQFFLSVGLYAPHTPLLAPKKYIDMYDPEQMPLSLAPREHDKDIPDIALRNGSNYDIFNGDYPEYSATPERQREAIASYYGCSSFIDAQIGLILEALKKEGLDKNTVIVLFSDHGFHLGEHGCWSKFTLFEQSTRVPLIVYVPGAEGNGKVCDEIVELVDVLPTLCDLWELPKSEQFESTSFAPLLENPDQPWKIAAFTTIPLGGLGRSVRTKQFRYSEYRESTALPGGEEEPFARELYNLENDPWEQINLINDERYRDEMKELAQLLKDGWKAGLPPGNKQSPRSIY